MDTVPSTLPDGRKPAGTPAWWPFGTVPYVPPSREETVERMLDDFGDALL